MSKHILRKRHFMKRSCFDKKRHETREAAYDHIRRLVADRDGDIMRVYFCSVCHGFHVGHPRGGGAGHGP